MIAEQKDLLFHCLPLIPFQSLHNNVDCDSFSRECERVPLDSMEALVQDYVAHIEAQSSCSTSMVLARVKDV